MLSSEGPLQRGAVQISFVLFCLFCLFCSLSLCVFSAAAGRFRSCQSKKSAWLKNRPLNRWFRQLRKKRRLKSNRPLNRRLRQLRKKRRLKSNRPLNRRLRQLRKNPFIRFLTVRWFESIIAGTTVSSELKKRQNRRRMRQILQIRASTEDGAAQPKQNSIADESNSDDLVRKKFYCEPKRY